MDGGLAGPVFSSRSSKKMRMPVNRSCTKPHCFLKSFRRSRSKCIQRPNSGCCVLVKKMNFLLIMLKSRWPIPVSTELISAAAWRRLIPAGDHNALHCRACSALFTALFVIPAAGADCGAGFLPGSPCADRGCRFSWLCCQPC